MYLLICFQLQYANVTETSTYSTHKLKKISLASEIFDKTQQYNIWPLVAVLLNWVASGNYFLPHKRMLQTTSKSGLIIVKWFYWSFYIFADQGF